MILLRDFAMLPEAISEKLDILISKIESLIETQKHSIIAKSEWLDKEETMRILKCSDRSLQTLRDDGILFFSNPLGGTKYFYRRKDVMALFEKNFNGKI
jgi:hypothetical protein